VRSGRRREGELTGSANIATATRDIDNTGLRLGRWAGRRRRGGRGRCLGRRRGGRWLLSGGRRRGRVSDRQRGS
jgi:hypothetical protein